MKANRKIRKVFKSKPTLEGAGVHLKRAFANAEVPLFDPFLLFDDFRATDPGQFLPGFPWHPHRGIETITYVLEGTVEHGDSLGNKGAIGPGDVQWMTAGSGIIHQEMPKGNPAGHMGGFQLWANLPASRKMMAPRYREVLHDQIPTIIEDNLVKIRIISGTVKGAQGPVRDIVTDPEYLDISMPAGAEFKHPTKPGHTVFAYIIEGAACFCRQKDPFAYEAEGANYFDLKRSGLPGNGTLILFGDGEQVSVTTEKEPARFLLVSGQPIGEPVAWYGPIVMNTQQELQVAFDEYQNGTFIKPG
jgi:redox-sensitive bicupin YhaK (pirin superfamily)